ncbi:MAG: FAD-binding oxidoreductase, partial [Candidatus Dormibacteria bacterium]
MADPAALDDLRRCLGERASTDPAVLAAHSRDESHHEARLPLAVVRAAAVGEVVATLEAASRGRLPVTCFGAGTGLEGGAIPAPGGIVLSLAQMDRILRVSPDDLDATVEAGVRLDQLNSRLRHEGLFFPVDPGSNPTL